MSLWYKHAVKVNLWCQQILLLHLHLETYEQVEQTFFPSKLHFHILNQTLIFHFRENKEKAYFQDVHTSDRKAVTKKIPLDKVQTAARCVSDMRL